MDIVLIAALTLLASTVGTFTGFGTSTIMVPVLAAFLPLPQVLLLVGIIHWFGDIWKILLFRSGARWTLILLFGGTGIVASVIGGLLVFQTPEGVLARALGAFLLVYVAFIFAKPRFKVPQTTLTAISGGLLHGFAAGIFGMGGAVRGAFLAAFDLPKAVYILTSGAIGLIVDSGRIATYWSQGASFETRLLWGLLLFVPVSFAGAKIAERIVERVPQERFRVVVAVFLGLVALQLLLFPTATRPGQREATGDFSPVKADTVQADARGSERRCSEIRLVRRRDRGVAAVVIFIPILGTDMFHPFAQRASIGDSRGPWRCEDAFIFNGNLHLHVLTLVVRVEVHCI